MATLGIAAAAAAYVYIIILMDGVRSSAFEPRASQLIGRASKLI